MGKAIVMEMFNDAGWIKVNRKVGHKLGLYASIMLGELISIHAYWNIERDRYFKQMGYNFSGTFFHMRDKIQFNTTLSPKLQRKGEDALKEYGMINVELKGLPSKNHYTVNWDKIEQFFDDYTIESIEEEEYEEPEKDPELSDIQNEYLQEYLQEYECHNETTYRLKKDDKNKIKKTSNKILQELIDNIYKWWKWKEDIYTNEKISNGDGAIAIMLSPSVYNEFLNIKSEERRKKRMAPYKLQGDQ